MEFIVACIVYVLYMALMFILMFAAFELALYLVAAVIELCCAVKAQGFRVTFTTTRTLKDMHRAGWETISGQRFALV